MAKNNTTLYLAIGAAVVGYLAYKKGLLAKYGLPAPVEPALQLSSSQDIEVATSPAALSNVIAPKSIDVTGEQIQFY